MTDEKLIAAYVKREPNAEVIPTILYGRHFKPLRRMVWGLYMKGWGTTSEAALIAEQGFLKTMLRAKEFDPAKLSFRQFARMVTANCFVDRYMKDERRRANENSPAA